MRPHLYTLPTDAEAGRRREVMRSRVAFGIGWLERREGPGWVERIDVYRLDMGDPGRSVWGQLYGRPRWWRGPRLSPADRVAFGFALEQPTVELHRELTAVWRREIGLRTTPWEGPDPEDECVFLPPDILPRGFGPIRPPR